MTTILFELQIFTYGYLLQRNVFMIIDIDTIGIHVNRFHRYLTNSVYMNIVYAQSLIP